jgi:tight adherence protein B
MRFSTQKKFWRFERGLDMEILIGLGIFIVTVLVIEEGYFIVKAIWKPELKKIKRRLRTLSFVQYSNEAIDIEKKKILSQVSWLNRVLLNAPGIQKLERILEQADISYPIGFFILLSLLFFAVGHLAASLFTSNSLSKIAAAAGLFMIPSFYIYLKRKKRMEKFQMQLPDALELIARALKAGHAFTGGLKMVAEDFDDPIGTEFDKTLNEINFGVDVPEALKKLSRRVDCEDLKFFIVSVILQRETGGNLAEIIENLSLLIRERFKLKGRIRVLAAEGKLSAIILILLPFFIAFYFFLIQPKYIELLFKDPLGIKMIVGAVFLIIAGVLIMKKLVTIKV